MRFLRLLPMVLLVAGCGAGGSSAADAGSHYYLPDGGGGADAGGADMGSRIDMGPPEVEMHRDFSAPASGSTWVYVANPTQDHVAVIDSRTLSIHTVEAGDQPTYLAVLPGTDTAIVLNVGSNDANVLRTDAAGATTVATVPTIPGANRISIGPGGVHAVIWRDASDPGAGGGVGTGSFQDITLLTLGGPDRVVDATCGFQPYDVQFSADGATAFIVSQDGVSIARFGDVTSPRILPLVGLGDTATGTLSNDVTVTGDGRYAVARREGETSLRLVTLEGDLVVSLDLGAVPTDVDVSPGGEFALAVIRSTGALLQIPIPGGFSDPTQIVETDFDPDTVGSVEISPDAYRAVLYTTAAPVLQVVVVDLTATPDAPRFVRLRKAVRAVALAPNGAAALVVHTKEDGSPDETGLTLEQRIARSYGYTMVDLASGFAKLQVTRADVGPLALSPDSSYAFTFLRDDFAAVPVRDLERIDLASFLVDDFSLGSPPLSIGVAPATTRVFVGEDYPEGRIAFLDWTTGMLRSVTGYELNGRIVR